MNTRKILVFILLGVCTFGSAKVFDRYQEIGPEVLADAGFQEGLTHWNTKGPAGAVIVEDSGVVRLTSHDENKTVQLSQNIQNKAGFNTVRISGKVRIDNVTQGKKAWHRFRMLLISLANNKWIPVENGHGVIELNGTVAQQFEKVFEMPGNTEEVRFVAELSNSTGTAWLEEITLHEVKEVQWYPWIKGLIFFLWGGFGMWLLKPYFSTARYSILQYVGLLLIIGIILIGTTVSIDIKEQLVERVLSSFYTVGEFVFTDLQANMKNFDETLPGIDFTKVGHFIFFAGFGFLGALDKRRQLACILADITMLAIGTELLQLYCEGRTPIVGDVLLDVVGGVLGAVLSVKLIHKEKG